ncbi:MAG TPA: ATP-binding protein [Blastocatellia bacterium]|nr:ATP-binding protein [Blastocatellia bacterium]
MTAQKNNMEERVLVLAPIGRDAALTCQILSEEGIESHPCRDMDELCRECLSGAGAVLVTEEAMNSSALKRLISTLDQQPLWSDLPLILFTGTKEGARFFLETAGPKLNLTILERPINIAIVVSAVQSALRARYRQYQMREVLLQMENANKAKDEFLATVSHELRTPLNAMLGWVGMLRSGKLDESTTAHALEVFERNAKSQAQLIEDLLDVSRIISGKLRLDVQPVDISSIVQLAIDVVRPAADAKEVRLQIILDPQAGPVSGDPGRLQQVIWNLLSNAVKFTHKGGRVQVRVARKDSYAEITVSDTGQGINPEFLPYVFDRFRQADSTLTRKYGGMGLGLAIVRHLVELHGGTVSAFSDGQGQGSTFTVKLPIMLAHRTSHIWMNPIERDQVIASAEIPFDCPPTLEGFRLLIVEDEPDARDLLTTILQQCKAEVRGVATPAEAMQELNEWKPDVLVSDIQMPGEDGYSLIRKVRLLETERAAKIPAIALTAHARVEDRMRALSSGYDAHVAKPVEPAELITVIASLVRRTEVS